MTARKLSFGAKTPPIEMTATPKERLVIPTAPPAAEAQQVRTKTVAAYQPPPKKIEYGDGRLSSPSSAHSP